MTPRLLRDPLGEAERSALLEEGLSMARHDLRNNLATIRNATFYLRRKMSQTDAWETDARVPRFFAIIEEEITGAQASVDETVLSDHLIKRITAPTDALACLHEAISWSRASGEATIITDRLAAAPPLTIAADRRDVAVALRALVENAFEASPAGAAVAVRVTTADHRVAFTVSDVGGGIMADQVAEVMARFFSTKQGHDGLGLNVATRIARRYGGMVTIHPTEQGGIGASVELALPLVEGAHGTRADDA